MQKTFSDREIMDGLLRGGLPEDLALRQVYLQNRAVILDLIKKNKGSLEEAKDVFQEAIMAFYENIKSGKFKGESAISSYLYSIARFIWLNKLKRKNIGQRIIETKKPVNIDESFLPRFFEKEKEKQILDLFGKLGSDCKKVLILNIYKQYSMDEIADEMKYENGQVARNKKYKCLKKLKKMIADNPSIIELLKQ